MKIIILGAGRIGVWLAGELSEAHRVAVYDPERAGTGKRDMRNVKVLAGPDAIGELAPDLLVNAADPLRAVSAFSRVEAFIPGDCVLVDTAPVKGEVRDYYRERPFRFVSLCPMFGPTQEDVKDGKDGSAVIIKESDREGAAFFRAFFASRSIRTFEYSFEEHDRMVTRSLTIPFISSLTFAASLEGGTVPGTFFARLKGIAEGVLSEDDRFLAEILFNSSSLAELDRITARLEFLKHVIRARDFEEAHLFFEKLRGNMAH